MTPLFVAAVLCAGVVGGLTRYGLSLALARRPQFPWAVLVVNLGASAIGGVTLGLAYRGIVSSEWRLLLLTGLAGGISTFSTWSVETIQLITGERWRTAVLSVALNLVLGLGAAAAAFAIIFALA